MGLLEALKEIEKSGIDIFEYSYCDQNGEMYSVAKIEEYFFSNSRNSDVRLDSNGNIWIKGWCGVMDRFVKAFTRIKPKT